MKIAVIGAAGTLGSCTAYTLVNNKLADEILLIDPFESALYGQWIDLEAVGAMQGIAVRKGSYGDLSGTGIVILAASTPANASKSRLELLPSSLPIMKIIAENINHYAPEAIIITETNPVDPLNYALYLLSTNHDRRRFIGYTLNDSIRFRKWSAEALGVNPERLRGTVIGEHGHTQVMLFSSLRLDGHPITIDQEIQNKIRSQPPLILKTFESLVPRRTPGWTSAYGTALVIQAIEIDSKSVIPCSTILAGEYGLTNTSLSVPIILGKEGIEGVQSLQLTAEEEKDLERSAQTLRPFMQIVEDFVGVKFDLRAG